jgi:hypothetical protein
MSNLSPDEQQQLYKDIRKRVHERFEKRKEFFSHLAGYLFSMIGTWFFLLQMDTFSHENWTVMATIITVFWSMGIVIHGTQYVFDELRERTIERELERAGIVPGSLRDKAKREQFGHDEKVMRLSEDGELEEIGVSDYEDYNDENFYGKT